MNQYEVGRFRFELPDTVRERGREQRVYKVALTEVATAGAADFWKGHVAAIRLKAAPTYPGKTFMLAEKYPAVIYRAAGASGDLATLEALKDCGSHVLILRFVGLAEKQPAMEQVIRSVADDYVPGGSGFSAGGRGAFTGKPSRYEDALASFGSVEGEPAYRFATETVGTILASHPLEDIALEQKTVAAQGSHLDVLRNTRRLVAGLNGFEGRVLLREPNGSLLRFTWFFPGTPGNSHEPQISVQGVAAEAQRKELESGWEILLESVRSSRAK